VGPGAVPQSRDGSVTSVIGIVTALEMERRWIRTSGPLVELSGIGDTRAAHAANQLVERGATALVSWGVAGGLDPDLSPGTVILPDTVIDADGSSHGVDLEWRDRLLERVRGQVVISTSPLYHVASVITTVDERRAISERFGAGAVDMEIAAVARVAFANHLPWIAVRVVIDAADQELPEAILTATGADGRLRVGPVVGFLLRPRLWRPLIVFGRAGAAAGRSMRRLWAAAQPDLALS
jgi:adenosylhomocysteine nucleosidase